MSMHFLQHWSPAWCAWLSALLVVCFETIVPANSRSFCLSPQLFLGSWTTPLTIFFTPLSETLQGARLWSLSVYHKTMFFPLLDYGPNGAHWDLQ